MKKKKILRSTNSRQLNITFLNTLGVNNCKYEQEEARRGSFVDEIYIYIFFKILPFEMFETL